MIIIYIWLDPLQRYTIFPILLFRRLKRRCLDKNVCVSTGNNIAASSVIQMNDHNLRVNHLRNNNICFLISNLPLSNWLVSSSWNSSRISDWILQKKKTEYKKLKSFRITVGWVLFTASVHLKRFHSTRQN